MDYSGLGRWRLFVQFRPKVIKVKLYLYPELTKSKKNPPARFKNPGNIITIVV